MILNKFTERCVAIIIVVVVVVVAVTITIITITTIVTVHLLFSFLPSSTKGHSRTFVVLVLLLSQISHNSHNHPCVYNGISSISLLLVQVVVAIDDKSSRPPSVNAPID